ncbi:slipin family protein [Tessaracoccus sp. HDW20]|uniref:SPFH domain-containing protein n=1 Tax=Tessaracoccus coleopterorum TaxID=2714950 RepID=UPI0018D34450|nr:SPFH domain-containing protein [Tessaracoccus coleopterorum]NHB85902.1 slipin family protein [Tessaracoccus coleopterorum]
MRTSRFHLQVDPSEVVVAQVGAADPTVLTPGRHRRVRHASYRAVSMTRRLLQLAPQEIPTADGGSVRVTAVAQVQVCDPVLALTYEQPDHLIYLAIQLALRDAFAELELEEAAKAVRTRPEITAAALSAAREAASGVGHRVDTVVIKDVLLPQEFRAAAIAVLTARAKGQAQLEAARAETAALRSLANGAKILEDHPSLAKLRMVQAIPMGSSLSLRVDEAGD